MKKSAKPRVGLFLAQPCGTLVGENKPFSNHLDLCRWAADQGFNGVTAPACNPYVDIKQVLSSKGYGPDLLGQYEQVGTPLLRLEKHTVGQRQFLHTAGVPRYEMFVGGVTGGVKEHEIAAENEALEIVEATHKLGFKHLVTFSGNRGWTAAKYPWSAYPKEWRLNILLLCLAKHRKVLARCAELGIKWGAELHPEEDLNSPLLLYWFRELAKKVAPETVSAIFANADASHPTLAGDEAALHFAFLAEHGLLGMCHLKDGELGQNFLASDSLVFRGGSIRGDFAPKWSESMRRFCTFGTGMADWGKIIPILLKIHDEQEEGLDFIIEGECSKFPDMRQSLKIAVENARLVLDGKPPAAGENVEPLESSNNWEDFCTSDVPASKLLEMSLAEHGTVTDMIELLDPETLKHF